MTDECSVPNWYAARGKLEQEEPRVDQRDGTEKSGKGNQIKVVVKSETEWWQFAPEENKTSTEHKCKLWVNNKSAKQAGENLSLAAVGGYISEYDLVQGRNFLPVFTNRYRWLGCLFFWGEKT